MEKKWVVPQARMKAANSQKIPLKATSRRFITT